LGAWGILQAQKPFREYAGGEGHAMSPLPPDWERQAEWTRARLRYNSVGRLHFPSDVAADWGPWTVDYPRTDRHFLVGIRRLTRVDAKSVEQVVDLDNTDDIYNWPFLYGVEVGHWILDEEQAAQMRDYLLRGGFFMTDDFHGTREWDIFMESMEKVLPGRTVVDIDNKDPIFHVIYDLDDRFQVPGAQYLYSGIPYEYDGFEPKWRAIRDARGRIVAAICHNMDLGDAIEWSDDPRYPEKLSSLAYRVAANFVLYDLTH
jgi:hypothetical protein